LLIVAAQQSYGSSDLMELSLEDLMNIEITSVSKTAEKLSDAAAAVYVITSDDIRRSGYRTLPDVLKLAPGLQVAHIDANRWAISSRGFNYEFADKLLVLIDGRSVYTKLFSGVYWNEQNINLDDVERIEIIRGPGATLWGANAVNGVINVITKESQDTQGGHVSVSSGNEIRNVGVIRYGGTLGKENNYRVYGRYYRQDHSVLADGASIGDDWDVLQAGFRIDWNSWQNNTVTVQGDVYGGNAGAFFTLPIFEPPYSQLLETDSKLSGGNVLARWTHSRSEASGIELQAYFDRTKRHHEVAGEDRNTFDLDFQVRHKLHERLEVIGGLGYQITADTQDSSSLIWFDSKSRTDNLLSAFLQGSIALIDEKLNMTVGSKFEHNDYTGFEYQPSIRMFWRPGSTHSLWASVSRAVHTPSRWNTDVTSVWAVTPAGTPFNPGPLPLVLTSIGNKDLRSEELTAYELGYRVRPRQDLSLDVATFYNNYEGLGTVELGSPFLDLATSAFMVMPAIRVNGVDGKSYGGEWIVNWWPHSEIRLEAAYSLLLWRLDDPAVTLDEENPEHQVWFRIDADASKSLRLGMLVRYIDDLPAYGVDNVVALDTRLGWAFNDSWELEVAGQNLLEPTHLEFPTPTSSKTSLVERRIHVALTKSF